MLKLADLGLNSKKVLLAIHEVKSGSRNELVDKTGLEGAQVSSALSRLENFSLVALPTVRGGTWTITEEGMALAQGKPLPAPWRKAKKPRPQPAPVAVEVAPAVIEPESTPEPEHQAPAPEADALEPFQGISEQILNAMEIEVQLDRVRARLEAKPIPAQAQRVYANIVTHLPLTLRAALGPVTELVELFGGL